MALDLLKVVAGVILLVVGGELLVRGGSGLARRLGMSPLLVGLTVVSVATGAPELAVTLDAVATGRTALAVGNIVGSNIANLMLVLGVGALVRDLMVQRRLGRMDLPFLAALSGAFWLLAADGVLTITDGMVLLAAVLGHTVWSVRQARKQPERRQDPPADEGRPANIAVQVLFIVVGVGLLVGGASLLVSGASGVALALGVSQLVVGLTVVAVGTSLPELAASVIAISRGETDLAIGNAVGSNIVNLGLVAGLAAVIAASGVPVPAAALTFDIPVMIASTVLLLVLALTGFVLKRWEGGVLLLGYAAFTAIVVWTS